MTNWIIIGLGLLIALTGAAQPPSHMILIKTGEYTVGATQKGEPDEKPARKISLSAFYIDPKPVTYLDFATYVKAGGTPTLYWNYPVYHQPDHPVTGLSWYHAIDYCNWRSHTEGYEPAYKPLNQLDSYGYPLWELDPEANGYRLPTEAEWEVAAKSGKDIQYPWGNDFIDSLANYDNEKGLKKGKWWRLAKVSETYRNAWGLYNMSGNIWHWCNDWYDSASYRTDTRTNPQGAKKGRTKALRGGSWGSASPAALRTTNRSYTAPSQSHFDVGFRCVRPAISSPKKPQSSKYSSFFRYTPSQKSLFEPQNDFEEEWTRKIPQYIADHFPNSLYFAQQVDQQKKLNSTELAKLILIEANQLKINPLFLLAVLTAESAIGSCSFCRWYNNPMAYHWQNRLMDAGEPVYEDLPNQKNRKFRNLSEGFRAFGNGIRKKIYYDASAKTFEHFHQVYVGYEAQDWIFTISKIYQEVAGIRLTATEPATHAGQYIYQDWATINPNFGVEKEKKKHLGTDQPLGQLFFLIYGSYSSEKEALPILEKYQQTGFAEARILVENGKFRIALKACATEKEAQQQIRLLKNQFPDIWIWRKKK